MDFEENAEVIEAPVEETVEETVESEEVVEGTAETEESAEEVTVTEEQSEDTPSEEEKFSKTFEISHEDIRYALYVLLSSYEEQDNEWYGISAVYDNYFVYEGFFNESNKFRQNYKKDGDDIVFDGERIHINVEYLTDSELTALNEMRSNYSEISKKLAEYEAEPEKMAILESDEYSSISDLEEFVELKKQEGHIGMSVNEVREKADAILLNYAKTGKVIFTQASEESPITMKPIPIQASVVRSRYGGLGK